MSDNPYQPPVAATLDAPEPSRWARVTRVAVCIGVVGGLASIGGMITIAFAGDSRTREITGLCIFAIGNVIAAIALVAIVLIGAVRSLVVFRSKPR